MKINGPMRKPIAYDAAVMQVMSPCRVNENLLFEQGPIYATP